MNNRESLIGTPVLAYWDLQDDKIVVFYKEPVDSLTIDPQSFEDYLANHTSHLNVSLRIDDPDNTYGLSEISQMTLPEFVEYTSARELAVIAHECIQFLNRKAA